MIERAKPLTGRILNVETGTGIPGVGVSDGLTVVRTNDEGTYRLPWDPSRRGTPIVQCTLPAGYRLELDDAQIPRFFHRIDAETDPAPIDFALVPHPASTDERFRFGQLTDIHVDESTAQTADRVSRHFRRVATGGDGSSETSPTSRFTVVSGDLTNLATDQEFAAFRSASAASPLPVWPVAGNHDLLGQGVGGPYPRPRQRPPFTEAINAYRHHVGPEWYSFQYGAAHFVMLDNFRGLSDPDQFTWLERDLATNADGRDVVVIAHVPWNVPQTKHWERAREYLELLADHGARLFLAGHTHANDVAREPITGALHAVTTSTSFGLDHTPRGYRMVDLAPGDVRTTFVQADGVDPHGADRVPAEIDTSANTPVPGTPWPMFHRDAQRGGAAPSAIRPPLRRAWSHDCGGSIFTASPVVTDDTVVIGVRDEHMGETHGVVAVDLVTGQRRWRVPADGPVEATAAIVDSVVLTPEVRGPLRGLDLATGEQRWSWSPQQPKDGHHWMYFSPVVQGDTVYQAFIDRSGAGVAALDVASGSEVWRTEEPIGRNWIAHGSPAVDNDVLVFTTAYSNLVRLDAHDGTVRWQSPFTGWTRSMPTLTSELALLACPGDLLVAVRPDTGETVWRHTSEPTVTPAPTTATPAYADGVIYAAFHNGRVTALRETDGAVLWSTDVGAPITASPALAGTTLYVADDTGRLSVVDARDGQVSWSLDLGRHVASSPAVTGNTVLVATGDGVLHALTGGVA